MSLQKRTYSLPAETIAAFEKEVPAGNRSEVLAEVLRHWLDEKQRARLRAQIIEGCREMADVYLEVEREYHPLEEEVQRGLDASSATPTDVFMKDEKHKEVAIMSTTTEKQLLTAEEFCEFVHLPENANKWFELERGEVIELPPPMKRHGVVCANVVRILGNYTFQRRKGYVTANDSGVILERDPDTVRGPDAAIYEDAQKFEEVPPRLAVEVLSPNDRADRVTRKLMDYLRNGVPLVWLIDPEARLVTVYRSEGAPYDVAETEDLTGNAVLPELRCKVADLFFLPAG